MIDVKNIENIPWRGMLHACSAFITNIIALKIHSHLFDPREPYHVMHNLSIFNALLKFFSQEYLCAFNMKKSLSMEAELFSLFVVWRFLKVLIYFHGHIKEFYKGGF